MPRRSRAIVRVLLFALLVATAAAATAQVLEPEDLPAEIVEAAEPAAQIDKGDTAFMLVCAALVLLMTPGLAFFYGGLVRRKNVLSVLMQCFMSMCLMTVLWVIIGYSIAFGESKGGWFGDPMQYFMLEGVGMEAKGSIPHLLFMIFQGMFAVITPALIIGAFAERMRFGGFCVFSALWLLLVYCPVAHWAWGGGFFDGTGGSTWLMAEGYKALDFAGGTVVHINAGVAALVAAFVLGRRQGYPGKISPPHHMPFAMLGAAMLWFGWFGFNAGSELAADGIAANAFVTTHVATAMAGLTWSIIEWLRNGKATALGMITGAVAGLVAITPACGFVSASGALLIGLGASILAYIAVTVVKPALRYDDSLDVFGVHGVAGIWGALATGFLATESIGGFAASGAQFWSQVKAVGVTIVYCGVVSLVLYKLVDVVVGLKVSDHEERVGLDLTEHAEHAYTLVE